MDPTWGGSPLTCGDCHNKPMTGQLTSGGITHTTDADCNSCHADVVDTDNIAWVDENLHVNGAVDVSTSACTACHTSLTSGSHTEHVTVQGYTCVKCHNSYYGQPTHDDGALDTITAVNPVSGLRAGGTGSEKLFAGIKGASIRATWNENSLSWIIDWVECLV